MTLIEPFYPLFAGGWDSGSVSAVKHDRDLGEPGSEVPSNPTTSKVF
jgi:hypothetical protein